MDGAFLVTLITIEGRPALRISIDGQSHDYPLRDGQIRLLLRQLVEWILK